MFIYCNIYIYIHHLNRIINKNHIITSIHADKTFDKVCQVIMVETFNTLGI